MTVSLAVRSWLALAVVVGLGACAGRKAPASSPVASPTAPLRPGPKPGDGTPAPEAGPEVEGLANVAAFLARKHVRWMPADTRMALARRGAVRLRPDGPEHGLADAEAFAISIQLTVVDDAPRPRVLSEQGGVRLLLYVDRADATPVVRARAPLAPSAGFEFQDPPRRGHVVVLPGTWVRELEHKNGAVFVSLDRKRARRGWIDPAAVGTTFVGQKVRKDGDAGGQSGLLAKRRTKLRTRPGDGRALVSVQAGEPVRVLTERAKKGYQLVEYKQPGNDEVAFVGFVAAGDLQPSNIASVSGSGRGWFSPETYWGDAESAPRVEVEAGRFLLDAQEPVVVGCLVQPAQLADLGEARYAVATLWGPIPVRLAPESVRGRCGDAPTAG